MSFPNAPRRGKEDARPDHFAYLRGYKGEELYGYVAAPLIWIELHTSDWGSKPCLKALTKGELKCGKCKDSHPVCKGALGFYHWKDYKPYFLWMDESKRDDYDALRWLDKVKFGREKIKGAPVWAQKCFEQERSFASTRPQCRQPADLTESLLRIFDDNALTLWYRQTHGAGDNALSLPEKPEPAPGPKPKKVKLPAAKVAEDQAVAEEMKRSGDPYDAVIARLRERMGGLAPSANGKHKPKGGAQ